MDRNPLGLAAEIKNDFDISPPVFYCGLVVLVVGLILGTVLDYFHGLTDESALDLVTLLVVGCVTWLVVNRRLSLNTGFQILIYCGAINFVYEEIRQVFIAKDNTYIWGTGYNLFILAIFMAFSGFVVSRNSAIIFGATLLALLLLAGLVRGSSYVRANLWYTIPSIVGYTLVLYLYRSYLERLIANLFEANRTMRRLQEQSEKTLESLKSAQKHIVAQEKQASLGLMTAGIAHEIKNPLNLIINFSEASLDLLNQLQENLAQANSGVDISLVVDDLRQNLADIATQGRRSNGIIRSMLQLYRAAPTERTTEDLHEVVAESTDLAYQSMRSADSTFECALVLQQERPGLHVKIVRPDFSRVVLNLCMNAFQSLKSKTKHNSNFADPTVTISTSLEGQFAVITVADNGLGFGPEVHSHLFVPFFTTKPPGEGTGLGLSLSYEIIVNGHMGRLEAEGVEGESAQFRVKLPL